MKHPTLFTLALLVGSWVGASADVAAQSEEYTLYGSVTGSRFGQSVAGGLDVNGDGLDDIIIGAPGLDDSRGRALVYSGLDGSFLHAVTGTASGQQVGRAVSLSKDLDGDNVPDFLVGIPGDAVLGSGSVSAYSGATGALITTISAGATSVNGNFGFSIASVGNINGVAGPEILVGAPRYDDMANNGGHARLYSQNGNLLATIFGLEDGALLGHSVAAAGDVNKDGVGDFIVGAPFSGLGGRAKVYSGATGQLLQHFQASTFGTAFGWSVAGAGDVNGDGYADLLVGDPHSNETGSQAGSVTLYSGKTGNVLGVLYGDNSDDWFGYTVCGAGDLDNDGYADFAVGAYGDDDVANNCGSVHVYSGGDSSVLLTAFGQSDSDRFGASIAYAGKTTGVYCDSTLVVGAPQIESGDVGYARVYKWSAFAVTIKSLSGGAPRANDDNELEATCATPDGAVLLAGGKNTINPTPATDCGFDWGINNATEFLATADGDGRAAVQVFIPRKARGRLIPVQAIDVTTCAITPVTMVRF